MTPDIAKKRVRVKRTKPFLQHLVVHMLGTNEYGEMVNGAFNQSFPCPIQWQPNDEVVLRCCQGNFVITVSCAKIKRWPKKGKK